MVFTRESRLKFAHDFCRPTYDNMTRVWVQYAGEYASDLVRGRKVLEIGCGSNGGVYPAVMDLGASDYLGVDIEEWYTNRSKKLFPDGNFICDEPAFVIGSLEEPHIIVSCDVFDICIMDEKYAAQLIKVIAQKTPSGEHTIHWTGGGEPERFSPYFLQAGFERVREDDTGSCFMVFRKKGD